MQQTKGLTLIELLVSISIATLIVGITAFMLKTSVDTYTFAQNEALLQQVLRESTDELTDGTDTFYGIKDLLEIISASGDSIVFVPPFIDGPYDANADGEYTLSLPIKPGSPIPIAEIKKGESGTFMPEQITFIYGKKSQGRTSPDKVIFSDTLPIGSTARFVYHPDTTNHKEACQEIKWGSHNKQLALRYRNKNGVIPLRRNPSVRLDGVSFEFYDNTNTKIIPEGEKQELSAAQIPMITAVKIILNAQIRSKAGRILKQKSMPAFINIRNTRNFGSGIIIRKGTKLKISDSHHIRTFSIGNIVGVKKDDIIELEARPEHGTPWRVKITFNINEQDLPVIKKYQVEYPPATIVYSETINRTVDLGLNFLTLGENGRYDYDYDANVSNLVDIKGEVWLTVNKMDVDGASLFVRP